jgi:hypothetical protein
MPSLSWSDEITDRNGDVRIEAEGAKIFFPSRLYDAFTLFFGREPGEDFETVEGAKEKAEELRHV